MRGFYLYIEERMIVIFQCFVSDCMIFILKCVKVKYVCVKKLSHIFSTICIMNLIIQTPKSNKFSSDRQLHFF
uniref:Uncharacterized protein n=1 Tax=Populus trichocarpa TaxID=3694 RepID=A0A2K2B1P6_POPTR